MAIVFTSSRKKQRILFWSISVFLIVILFLAIMVVFPWRSLSSRKEKIILSPDVKINFDILNSDRVKSLEPFIEKEPEVENIGRKEPFSPN